MGRLVGDADVEGGELGARLGRDYVGQYQLHCEHSYLLLVSSPIATTQTISLASSISAPPAFMY